MEWKYNFQHLKILNILFGIMLIPSIYAVIFLSSLWNPYGELNRLPVVVVNQDRSVMYHGKRLEIGNQLVKGMKKTDSLDFHFLNDEVKANRDLKAGKYYMVLVIPQNFSSNATTLLTNHPKQMELDYQTSAGHSFVAAKLVSSATLALKDQVSTQVTQLYTKVLIASLQNVGQGMLDAATGSNKLAMGSEKIASGNQKVSQGLNKLTDSTSIFASGSDSLVSGLNKYTSGIASLNSGAAALNTGINQLKEKTNPLASGINKISRGSETLANGINTYTSGVGQVKNGASELNSHSSQLTDGISGLSKGLGQLENGSSQVSTGILKIHDQISSNDANLGTLDNGLNQMKAGLSSLNSELSQPSSALSSSLESIKNGIQAIETAINGITSQNPVTTSLNRAEELLKSSNPSEAARQKTINEIESAKSSDEQRVASMNQITGQLMNLVTSTTHLTDQLTTSVSQLNEGYSGTSQNPGIYSGTMAMISALNDIENNTSSSSRLYLGSSTITNGLASAYNGAHALGLGINTYSMGVASLYSGVNQLDQHSATLIYGAGTLSDGLNAVNQKIPSLPSGIAQLASGFGRMSSGASELVNNSSKLTQGADGLNQGATRIHQGSVQLAEGSQNIGQALAKVSNGNRSLANSIKSGTQGINQLKPAKLAYKSIAQPVKTNQTETAKVTNNGTGMAPYLMSVALFVGCLTLNIIYDVYTPHRYPKNGFSWWTTKMSFLYEFVILGASVMYCLLLTVNRLDPLSELKTYFVLIVTACTFLSMVTFFNLVLGKTGVWFMLIFMLIQLGGTGGTYPIELSNRFFETIHPFLPMTYSINALRDTISIGNSISMDIEILISIWLIFNLFILAFFKTHINQLDKINLRRE